MTGRLRQERKVGRKEANKNDLIKFRSESVVKCVIKKSQVKDNDVTVIVGLFSLRLRNHIRLWDRHKSKRVNRVFTIICQQNSVLGPRLV